MKQYVVKGSGEYKTYVEVLQKDRGGYTLRMRAEKRWGLEEKVHKMSSTLFESCLRTGYFIELPADERA
ncbi:MAG: hypothetical protein ACLFSA_12265, partial [Spirochaetaceae bacterium]